MEQNSNIKKIKVLILNDDRIIEKQYDLRNPLYSFNQVLNSELKNDTEIIFSLGQRILHKDLPLNQILKGNFKFIQGFITTKKFSECLNEDNVSHQNQVVEQETPTQINKSSVISPTAVDFHPQSSTLNPFLVQRSSMEKPKRFVADQNTKLLLLKQLAFNDLIKNPTLTIDDYIFAPEGQAENVEATLGSYGEIPKFYLKKKLANNLSYIQDQISQINYTLQFNGKLYKEKADPNLSLYQLKKYHFKNLVKNQIRFVNIDDFEFKLKNHFENLSQTLDEIRIMRRNEEIVFVIEQKYNQFTGSLKQPSGYSG